MFRPSCFYTRYFYAVVVGCMRTTYTVILFRSFLRNNRVRVRAYGTPNVVRYTYRGSGLLRRLVHLCLTYFAAALD